MTMKSRILWFTSASVLAVGCGSEDPPPADLRLYDPVLAIDVAPSGHTVALDAIDGTESRLVLVDVASGEAEDVAVVGDPSRTVATGISDDRRVTALHGEPVEAGVWADGVWQDLGSPHDAGCGTDVAGAWDISADGEVVVGLAWNGCDADAFRWTEADGFTSLELLGEAPPDFGPPTNRATVISDDGQVVAGFAEEPMRDRAPSAWGPDGTGWMLTETSDLPGEVLSIDADGSVMAGILGADGFVWTEAGGLVTLPRTELALPSDPMFPNTMTGDGAAIFGAVGDAFFGVPVAFVWTEATGTRVLADVAAEAGVEIPEGVSLQNVLGVSADGTVLAGTAVDADLALRTFVMRVPPGTF